MRNTNATGLTAQQVEQSRARHGANVLTPPAKKSLWGKLMEKFADHLIIILLVAGVLSVCISCYEHCALGRDASVFFEPLGIFFAIFLAVGLAFVFEVRADREFALLNKVNDDEPVEVVRGGTARKVPKRDVVVGDIILLHAGDEVPADAELLEATQLKVDESSLTGEPLCDKTVDEEHFDSEATFPSNHVMRGTKVMEGHAVARVFAVGDKTENGKIFEAAQIDSSVRTPLNEQLDGLGGVISKISYAIAAIIIVGRCLIYLWPILFSGAPFEWVGMATYMLQTVMIAVTLIVVAVPEGLPMAVTLALAYSMRRMLKTNNLVRRMHACETMGATSVICTDKTGTLTENKMTVSSAVFFRLADGRLGGGDGSRLVEEAVAVNATAELDTTDAAAPSVVGNPTEGALLLWLNGQGVDYRKVRAGVTREAEVPFSTERKYMATVVRDAEGRRRIHVKGAPEIVLSLCAAMDGGASREATLEKLREFQNQGMRTLGFASQELAEGEDGIEDAQVVARGLVFIGMVAIADPVRPDVADAVGECAMAGIKVKMVTGDTPNTAREIARQIGLWQPGDGEGSIITGPEFAALTDEELDGRVAQMKIIARARPMDKKRLVEALQRNGEVVAVTGDGTNDAPALKAAHVGLSMGDGTSVAKEASDITIIDNSFSSIGRAVLWGRSLYRNIQRFLLFQLTVNVSACLLVLVGAFMGVQSPLTVTQMLWVNLIMDTFGAMALASLPPSRCVMRDKPRDRKAFIIDRGMATEIFCVGGIFFLIMIAMLYVCEHADIHHMADLLTVALGPADGLNPDEQTLLFSVFVMTHFWYMFDARGFRTGRSGLDLKGCRGFWSIVALILAGQVLIVEVLYRFFDVVPMSAADWCIITVLSSFVLWVREAAVLLRRWLSGSRPEA